MQILSPAKVEELSTSFPKWGDFCSVYLRSHGISLKDSSFITIAGIVVGIGRIEREVTARKVAAWRWVAVMDGSTRKQWTLRLSYNSFGEDFYNVELGESVLITNVKVCHAE